MTPTSTPAVRSAVAPAASPAQRSGTPRRRGGPVAVLTASLFAASVLAVGGCGHSTSDRYGALPSWLPKSTVQPDGVLTGTRVRPALTSEGDTVLAHVGGGTVLATVTGPEVPGEGLPYQARATTCTWTVTLSRATAPVAIRAADFTALDHVGAVYRTNFVPGQRRPPAILAAGHSVTFELRAVMLTGEGLMRWAPGGEHIIAKWDFEVEND